MKNLRSVFYVLSFFIFRPLVYILPFRIYLELIKMLSYLAAPFLWERERIALKNLFLIKSFSTEQVQREVKEAIQNVTLFSLLDFIVDQWDSDLCKQYVWIEGKEHLYEALQKGKGVLLAFVHSSILGVALPCVGQIERIYDIGRLERSSGFNFSSIHSKIRGHLWESIKTIEFTYINKKEEGISFKIRHLLKLGKVVSTSADGQYAEKFISVSFFDKKIQLAKGMFQLSTLFQAPILPLFCGFDWKEDVFRIWLGSPILTSTPQQAAEAFSVQFQEHLKKFPSHWTGWWRMGLFKDERGEEVFHLHSI